MKTEKYYLVLAVVTCILCVPALGEVELHRPDERGLIGRLNPTLTGIKELYVVIVPPDSEPNKDGLVWKELRAKIESKLKDAGIEMAPDVYAAVRIILRDVPELRVYIDMLKLEDLQKYVFRIQTSLSRPVYLTKERGLLFKADVWKVVAKMQAVSVESMPEAVINVVLEQVEAFIGACLTAHGHSVIAPDANGKDKVSRVATKKGAKPVDKPVVAKYKYAASKNSKVFHEPDCSSARRIKPENLIDYNSRAEVIKAGKRPCKRCKP